MTTWEIRSTTTKDNLIHQGLYYRPSKPGKKAILWVHGFTDNGYGDMEVVEELARQGEFIGLGVASFNTRGHDIVASIKKLDPASPKGTASITGGSAYEVFTDCIHDIEAGVSFLVNEGFSQIVIAGISTGANKVCYTAGTAEDARVAAVILASPISDVAMKKKELGEKYTAQLTHVGALVRAGQGDKLVEGLDVIPLTPNRYLSIFTENGKEDVFPYYQENPTFTVFSRITKPLLIVMGGADEYADRPVTDILETFTKHQKSKNFRGHIVPGAFHSFAPDKEKDAAAVMVEWITSI